MALTKGAKTVGALGLVAAVGVGASIAARRRILRERRPGDAVRLTVVRVPERGRAATLTLNARLIEAPAS